MRKVLSASILFSLALFAESASPAPACTSATAACTEWVGVGAGSGRTLVYRTHPLDTRNEAITRALVMVHGSGRNADGYFRTAIVAGSRVSALDGTLIVAPRFASRNGECSDALAENEVNWRCAGPQSWRSGGEAFGDAALTSFDPGDVILRRLARKDVFPNLKSIVVAGHSAGGQYVTRYAMANQVHDSLGVRVTYVVASPSSYTYPDAVRPAQGACKAADNWPYGLQSRSGYSTRLSDERLRRNLIERPTTFLVGEGDVLRDRVLDTSCAAMAQGANRLERSTAYVRHIGESVGAQHRGIVIPVCGHSARCMFTADLALPLLFQKE